MIAKLNDNNWPFKPANVPFFYGYIMLVISIIGMIMSIPGQTTGLGIFTDSFIEALGLSRTQLSVAYLLGTVTSALCLTKATAWYDTVGLRPLMLATTASLGLVMVLVSELPGIIDYLAPFLPWQKTITAFIGIYLCYWWARFLGQGMMTHIARNSLMEWFEQHRGRVNGIRGLFVSFGFSLAPLVLGTLINHQGWQGALYTLAVFNGVIFSVLVIVFYRDTPEHCGLWPDGKAPLEAGAKPNPHGKSGLSKNEVKKRFGFWLYCISLSMHALIITAVVFHIIAIFAEAGRSMEQALYSFIPMAVISTGVNFAAGFVVDRHRLTPYLMAMLLAFGVGLLGLILLHSTLGYLLLVSGLGSASGLWGLLSGLAWPRFYGRKALGAISGLNTSIMVLMSALGPVSFSLAYDLTGSFKSGAALTLVVLLGLLALAGGKAIPEDRWRDAV